MNYDKLSKKELITIILNLKKELSAWEASDDERKEMALTIINSIKEKEILLRELHHRVKNNLQVLNSLLALQVKNIKDPNTIDIFNIAINRIQSMAMLHETLYKTKDFSKINISEYIESLIFNLKNAYADISNKITINMDIENLSISIDMALPIGLIINELVTNSLKYAFPDTFQNEGKINVELHNESDNILKLLISDNGIGMTSNGDLGDIESLGLLLVRILCEDQLGGNIKLNLNYGLEYIIEFKI